MTIKILHQQGLSQRAIAKQLGISRNTVKKYLTTAQERPAYSKRSSKRPMKLDPYRAYISPRFDFFRLLNLFFILSY